MSEAVNGTLAQKIWIRENQIFIVLTVIIGVIAGLSAVLFTLAIESTTHIFFGLSPGSLRLLLVPTCVSLLTGFLLWKFFPDARGSGVPQTEAAFHLHEGRIPARVTIGKFITGVLCVGSGHSMGREGPSVQIGAGLASAIGRWLRLPPHRVQSLVPVGAAAALSAAFNTPVAAVLFALEEIIGDLNAGLIGSTVVASITSVIVERSILGNNPLFRVPEYRLANPAELIGYAALGLVGGLISLGFCKGLLKARSLFRRLPEATVPLQPAIGGLLIGVILVFFPQVMGVGYEYVDQALNGGLTLKLMVVLCALKLVATIISYASGNAGGIFAPSLYLGAMTGGAVGLLVRSVAPFPTADLGAYTLVGMGTLFAGIIRAPMTSVFMIFELTQDYQILVPLMVANMISFMISKHYQPKPIYHALLEQDGIHLPGLETKLAIGTWRAKDIMSRDFILVPASTTIGQAVRIERAGADVLLVGSEGRLQGIVTFTKMEDAIVSGCAQQSLAGLVAADGIPHVHPDHPLQLVLDRFGQSRGLLPVLSRADVNKIEGLINRESLERIFEKR